MSKGIFESNVTIGYDLVRGSDLPVRLLVRDRLRRNGREAGVTGRPIYVVGPSLSYDGLAFYALWGEDRRGVVQHASRLRMWLRGDL